MVSVKDSPKGAKNSYLRGIFYYCMKGGEKVTEKQKRFVEEYLIDLNATQAAIRAGYKGKNQDNIGSELLGKTCIREAINRQIAKRSKRTGVTQDRVINELAKIAFLDMTQVVDGYGQIKADATPEDRACIESIKYKSSSSDQGESVEREVKVASKLKALELLGKHLGMFSDKLNIEGAVPIVISGENELEE